MIEKGKRNESEGNKIKRKGMYKKGRGEGKEEARTRRGRMEGMRTEK